MEEPPLGILPTRPEMKTSYASWELASTGKTLSESDGTEIWLGFSAQARIANKSYMYQSWELFFWPLEHRTSLSDNYQDLSAVVRSQIRGDTVLPKT